MNRSLRMAVALLVAGAVLPAMAQFAKPDDAVKYRRAAFTLIGEHFTRIVAATSGRVPFDARAVAEDAAMLARLAPLPVDAFPPGSDIGRSEAQPAVWSEHEKFAAGLRAMQVDLAALDAAARSGELERIQAALATAKDGCRTCHRDFRRN